MESIAHKNKVALVCDVAELAAMFGQTNDLNHFLHQVVTMVAQHMRAAVCSIYLHDEHTDNLVMTANVGLKPEAVGNVRLKPGEGLVGYAFSEQKALCISEASKEPAYKFIPGIHEEHYEAFMAAPIIRGPYIIGILVVQDPQPGYFDDNDSRALRAIAAQLATTIENANLLLSLHRYESTGVAGAGQTGVAATTGAMSMVPGVTICGGIVQGRVLQVSATDGSLLAVDQVIDASLGIEDFERSLVATVSQLEKLQSELEAHHADIASLIFSAHILMLKDSSFITDIRERISGDCGPGCAIAAVVHDVMGRFLQMEDARFREKALDVLDIGYRLIGNLSGRDDMEGDYHGFVIMAQDLLPSDILRYTMQGGAGLILIGGNPASHVSILARALKIPTIILNPQEASRGRHLDEVLLDSYQGLVYFRPSNHVRKEFETLLAARRNARRQRKVREETVSLDGQRITLQANINLLSDLDAAIRLKAEGVGLYRSEFPFLIRSDFPSEEEQFRIYRTVLDAFPGHDVVLRALDIGGDKMLSYLPSSQAQNPFLGLRALRFLFSNKPVFSDQLRAMLRSGVNRRLKIMFPLVSSVDDFIQARQMVNQSIAELEEASVEFNAEPKLGIMIELPSAIEMIDELAAEADFFCIGTNDLIQYMLAVDRTNIDVAGLYLPYHPAILRALKTVVSKAIQHGIEVSLCGEMASEVRMLPFLLGIGLRRLSLDTDKIPEVQASIGKIDIGRAEGHAGQLLATARINEIETLLAAESQLH